MKDPLFNSSSILVTNPRCWASTNPRRGKFTLHQSLNVKVNKKRRFSELPLDSIKAKMGFPSDRRTDTFGGWASLRQGIFIEFSLQVPPMKWSEGIILRRVRQNSGRVVMWLDEDKKNAVAIIGKAVYFVASDVPQGRHIMSLKSQGNKAISLLINGIVLGPAGVKGFKGYKPTGTLEKVWSLEDYKKFKL